MPDLTQSQPVPLPGKTLRLTAVATVGGRAIRVWCTAAPLGSRLRADLDRSGVTRVAVQGAVDAGKTFDFTPDVGGRFTFRLEELLQASTGRFRGGYEGDTRGVPPEEIASNGTATYNLYVAEPYDFELGVGPDRATLRVYVLDDSIVKTTADVHGVATPAIVNTTSARAATAGEQVRGLVAGLVGDVSDAESGLVPSMPTLIASYVDALNRHIDREQSHDTVDADNAIGVEYEQDAESLSSQSDALSRLYAALDRHVRNANPDDEDAPGETGSADYHPQVDWSGLPHPGIRPSPSPAAILLAAAEWQRVFTLHRQSATAHTAPDGSSQTGTTSVLMSIHINFLAALISSDAADTENGAGAILISLGAKKV